MIDRGSPWFCMLLAAAMSFTTSSLVTAPAGAEPSQEQREQAMEKFKAGSAAYEAGHSKDAIDLFLEADHIAPHPAFAYNISLAYDALGDTSNALAWARTYLRRDPAAPDRLEMQAAIVRHQKHLASRGLQQVTVLSQPQAATVLVDGQPVGVTPWTGDIAPGAHQVTLRKQGHVELEHTFDLPKRQAIDVFLTLAVAAPTMPTPVAPAPVLPVPAPAEPAPDPGPGAMLFIGVGVGAVGVAGLALALGLELARGSAEDDAMSAATQLEAEEHADSMDTLQLGARVAVVAGAVLLAGGVTLIAFEVSGGDADESATLELGCKSWGCGPALVGSF